MSTKYNLSDEIPSEVICARLEELSKAVLEGTDAVRREFTMRIPAECDRDADLVLAAAAKRIRALEAAPTPAVVPDGWTVQRCSDPNGYIINSPSGSMVRICKAGSGGTETAFCMFIDALLASPITSDSTPAWVPDDALLAIRAKVSAATMAHERFVPYLVSEALAMIDEYLQAASPAPDEYEEVGEQYLVRDVFGNAFWHHIPHYDGNKYSAKRTIYKKREKGEGDGQ